MCTYCSKCFVGPKSSDAKNAIETKHDDDLIKEAWDHCEKSSKSIEVLYKNEDEDKKVLAKVHFRSYPAVSNIALITVEYSNINNVTG